VIQVQEYLTQELHKEVVALVVVVEEERVLIPANLLLPVMMEII
jgi:hypothetical protein